MSIFGKRTVETAPAVPAYEGYVEENLAGLQMIVAESTQEAFQLRAGMYISDVIMEESVLEGSAQPEVLMEGFIKDSFAKIKEIIEKLWAKVKAWFAKVKRSLEIFFTSGAKFIDKFKSEIEAKTSGGFTYEGFQYTVEKGKGDIEAKKAKLSAAIQSAVGDITSNTLDAQHAATGSAEAGNHKEKFDLKEEQEKIVKALGSESLADALKEIHKSFRNGKDSKEEFKDFSGNSKSELIALVSDNKKSVANVVAEQKKLDEDFARVLKAIAAAKAKIGDAKAEGEEATSKRGQAVTYAQHKFDMARHALSIQAQLSGVHVDAIKEAARSSEKVLKSFLRYKPAKESFAPEQGEAGSILESAMKFI